MPTPQPKAIDGSTVNLFCSGHTLLPDGRLLVTGGHFKDSMGIDQASLYDFAANTWTPLPAMNHGRWYPSVITLADGQAVVLSGSFATTDGKNIQNNPIPQVWDGAAWHELAAFPGDGTPTPSPIELFPCLHVAPDGRVFMSGSGGAQPISSILRGPANGPCSRARAACATTCGAITLRR